MSLVLTSLSSHILTILENELVSSEPAIKNMIVQEIELLISKLENLIEKKSPKVAGVANTGLTELGKTLVNMVQVADDSIAQRP